MVEIRQAHFAEILEATDLLAEYAAESSMPEMGEVNPQAEIYRELERLGMVQMLAAMKDGSIIGFASILTTILPHYGQKAATVESLFVRRSERKGGLGGAMIEACERLARDSGCKAIYFSAPSLGALEKVMEHRPRYRRSNIIFVRQLS